MTARKFTKRERAFAIRICQIAASGGVFVGDINGAGEPTGRPGCWSVFYDQIESALRAGAGALTLATSAWTAVMKHAAEATDGVHATWTRDRDIDVAGLLEGGWLPGDRVVRLRKGALR